VRRWLLPEHIEDVLPAEARAIERLRRDNLDLFATHGYELVAPPLLEYVESLLSGTGRDMDLATFKLVDRLSAACWACAPTTRRRWRASTAPA
jgi:ATP phosphoribosyltransferase regulatory subunit